METAQDQGRAAPRAFKLSPVPLNCDRVLRRACSARTVSEAAAHIVGSVQSRTEQSRPLEQHSLLRLDRGIGMIASVPPHLNAFEKSDPRHQADGTRVRRQQTLEPLARRRARAAASPARCQRRNATSRPAFEFSE